MRDIFVQLGRILYFTSTLFAGRARPVQAALFDRNPSVVGAALRSLQLVPSSEVCTSMLQEFRAPTHGNNASALIALGECYPSDEIVCAVATRYADLLIMRPLSRDPEWDQTAMAIWGWQTLLKLGTRALDQGVPLRRATVSELLAALHHACSSLQRQGEQSGAQAVERLVARYEGALVNSSVIAR
jgi:hypothetical protein